MLWSIKPRGRHFLAYLKEVRERSAALIKTKFSLGNEKGNTWFHNELIVMQYMKDNIVIYIYI